MSITLGVPWTSPLLSLESKSLQDIESKYKVETETAKLPRNEVERLREQEVILVRIVNMTSRRIAQEYEIIRKMCYGEHNQHRVSPPYRRIRQVKQRLNYLRRLNVRKLCFEVVSKIREPSGDGVNVYALGYSCLRLLQLQNILLSVIKYGTSAFVEASRFISRELFVPLCTCVLGLSATLVTSCNVLLDAVRDMYETLTSLNLTDSSNNKWVLLVNALPKRSVVQDLDMSEISAFLINAVQSVEVTTERTTRKEHKKPHKLHEKRK